MKPEPKKFAKNPSIDTRSGRLEVQNTHILEKEGAAVGKRNVGGAASAVSEQQQPLNKREPKYSEYAT